MDEDDALTERKNYVEQFYQQNCNTEAFHCKKNDGNNVTKSASMSKGYG